jgi:hypothetical protein
MPMILASARGQCATVPAIPHAFGVRIGAHAAQWPLWCVVQGEKKVLQLLSLKRDVIEEDA